MLRSFSKDSFGVDFIQNLPETQKGNKHILTCIDYATRWVIARPVRNMDVPTLVSFLYEDILMHHGHMKYQFKWKGPYYIAKCAHPYWLMSPNDVWSESTVNQSDLATWLAPIADNED